MAAGILPIAENNGHKYLLFSREFIKRKGKEDWRDFGGHRENNETKEQTAIREGWEETSGFLGTEKGGEPVPMRMSEVNRILGKVDELSETEEELKIPFVVGESVKVIDGPFNNFSGVIDEINEDKKKLKVMVKIFGRKNLLELSYMQVEKES